MKTVTGRKSFKGTGSENCQSVSTSLQKIKTFLEYLRE